MSHNRDEPPLPGAYLSPPSYQAAADPSNPSPSSSSAPVPSVVRTPPSMADLHATNTEASTSLGLGSLIPPERNRISSSTPSFGDALNTALANSQAHTGESQDQPGASPPRRPYSTIPFPRRNSSNRDLNAPGGPGMTESNLSERPDTLASLIRAIPGPSFSRGRRRSRTPGGGRPSLSRRTSSDPEISVRNALTALSPSTSRDPPVSGTPKRVSFDNESLQHGSADILQNSAGRLLERRDASPGLRRIGNSLERVKQFFSRPHSDPILPIHSEPERHQPYNPARDTHSIPSRSQSPNRLFDRRRNPAFWPNRLPPSAGGRHARPSHFTPCDPYDPPNHLYPHRRSEHLCHSNNGLLNLCLCANYLSVKLVQWMPSLELTVYYLSLSVRQLYRHLLLRVPSLYFSRVWRIIFEAQVSHAELDTLIVQRQIGTEFPISVAWVPPVVPPGLARFKDEWEEFIDHLLKEWKTFNVVSALLLSAILTIFQIDGTTQPVTRTAALASLNAGLFSIVYGGIYVIRFQSMKSMVKASRWAEAAQQTTTGILWNVWVFLSLPAVFLAYAVIFFCISMMSYVWTGGVATDPAPIADHLAWIPRTVITVMFAVGLAYLYMVITTFQSYTDAWPVGDDIPGDTTTETAEDGAPANGDRSRSPGRADERGRDPAEDREARVRRVSLRRFGSPDIFPRASHTTMPVTSSLPDLPMKEIRHSDEIVGQHRENGTAANGHAHAANGTTTNPGGFVSPSSSDRRQQQQELNNLTYGGQRSSPHHIQSPLAANPSNEVPAMWREESHHQDDNGMIHMTTRAPGRQAAMSTTGSSKSRGSPLKNDTTPLPAVEEPDGEKDGDKPMELVDLR